MLPSPSGAGLLVPGTCATRLTTLSTTPYSSPCRAGNPRAASDAPVPRSPAPHPTSCPHDTEQRLFGRWDRAAYRADGLDGTVPAEFVGAHAAQFERWIAADGGLDLQLLGIGRHGHIGFNEPSHRPLEGELGRTHV